jgi:hypothetical protein
MSSEVPPSLLFSTYRGKCSRGVKLTGYLHLVPTWWMGGATSVRPCVPSWRWTGQFHIDGWAWSFMNMETRFVCYSIWCSGCTEISKNVKCCRYRPTWPRGWIEVALYPFLTSALEGGGWSAPRPGRFTPGKDPVPIVQKARWAPGPVWTYAKNRTPTGIRSPDRPALSQSLYRPSYPAHTEISTSVVNFYVPVPQHLNLCSISLEKVRGVISVADY